MSSILLLTLAGPAILLVAALTLTVSKGAARSSRTSMLAVGATYAALLSQLPGVVAVLSRGAKTSTFGEGGAEAPWVAVRSDAVTTTMVLVVSALGIVVVKHALGQLAGDPRRDAFVARILETLSASLLLATAGTTPLFALAWVGQSFGVHRLLTFFPERRSAMVAARKKFALARVADVALVSAFVATYRTTGTTVIDEIGTAAPSVAVLLVVAALAKAAQLPFSGWLVDAVESPAPVSALLHAGVLNGGAFVLLRFSEPIAHADAASAIGIVVGGTTAALMSLSMSTQPSVKVGLAYSSAAHMGFTTALAASGAHSFALVHLAAHSFYKAYSFLRSGDAAFEHATPAPLSGAKRYLFSLVGVGVAFAFVAWAGHMDIRGPGGVLASVAFVLGIATLSARANAASTTSPLLASCVAIVPLLALFSIESVAAVLGHGAWAEEAPHGGLVTAASLVVCVELAAASLAQETFGTWSRTPKGRIAYVAFRNGLFLNSLLDRVFGAYRVSPLLETATTKGR
ncbi:MAG: proton-conducting transporter membrane subunit [Polyangiaceae bacterium]